MSGSMTAGTGGMGSMHPAALMALLQKIRHPMPAPPMAAGPTSVGAPMPPPNAIPPPSPGSFSNEAFAMSGRFGDRIAAHMTPGEIAVPPQVQTPKVKKTLAHAFNQAGVAPEQFVAGSPFASSNPETGAPEFSLWSAILPVLGGIAGSFIPGFGTAAGAALGGAAGGAAGGLIDKQTPLAIALQALGGAAGGYMGAPGQIDPAQLAAKMTAMTPIGTAGLDPAASALAAGTSAQAPGASALASGGGVPIPPAVSFPTGAGQAAQQTGSSSLLASPFSNGSALSNLWQNVKPNLGAGIGAGLGSGLAGGFAPQPPPSGPAMGGGGPKMGPINTNFGQLLGSGASSTPNFFGYDPYAAAAGSGYNFYRPPGT